MRSLFLLCLSLFPLTAFAQQEPRNAPPGFELSEPKTYQLKVLIQLDAPGGPLQGATAMGPIPMDWPEQQVKLIAERSSPGTTTRVSPFPNQAAMLVCSFSGIPANGSGIVERLYEVTRYRVKFTVPPESLRAPQKLTPDLRIHTAAAPGIEIKNLRMKKLHESLLQPELSAWEQVRAYFDWTRKSIVYQTGVFRGAVETVQNGEGDCEDLSAVFITLCRMTGIPARSVWIEGHAYAEFYLEDATGQGYWIPAELAGPEWFGETAQYGPILQKADQFFDPISRKKVRYVPQSARALGGAARLRAERIILQGM